MPAKDNTMLSKNDIERARRLAPSGYEFVKWDSEIFTKAFLSCFANDSLITVILGAGGSGKSVIYRMLASYFGDDALCLAPTGIAANNVNAKTIHSALGFKVKPYYEEAEFCSKAISALTRKKVLLLDEISMVSANLLDMILKHVKIVNTYRHSAESRIHVVLCGDPLQLRPVFDAEKLKPVLEEHPNLQEHWDFFYSKYLNEEAHEVYVLDNVYRQDDENFKALLGRIRLGNPTDEDIAFLNSRVGKSKSALVICPTNNEVDSINRLNIEELASQEVPYSFSAQYSLGHGIKDCGFSENIELYIGEKVMCTRNGYDEYGNSIYQNGTIGTITSFEAGSNGEPIPVITTADGRTFQVPRMEFTDGEFRRNPETKKLEYVDTACAMQIPLRPCYSVTYHKSQGLTLNRAYLKMPSSQNPPGLLYMGLSRVKSPDGLTISGTVSKSMFTASEDVKKYMESVVKR